MAIMIAESNGPGCGLLAAKRAQIGSPVRALAEGPLGCVILIRGFSLPRHGKTVDADSGTPMVEA